MSPWRVPEFELGAYRFPRLFLGDRGFLRRYGSQLSLDDITRLMAVAVTDAGVGLAVSDEATVAAASRIRDACGATVMLHTQDLLSVASQGNVRRCAATLRAHVLRRVPNELLRNDRLVGGFLEAGREVPPYGDDELAAAAPDEAALAFAVTLIEQARPAIMTMGGDWLDLCLCTGRPEPIETVARTLRAAAGEQTPLLAFSYLGAILCPDMTQAPGHTNGLAIPVNLLGDGMLPDRAGFLAWTRRAGGPILAVHALALGCIPVAPALDFVWNHVGVPLAVVGASTDAHITTLIGATRRVLGRTDC